MHEHIDHDVRRLAATATTDALVRYVQELADTSYDRGFRNGYYRREDARPRTVLWLVRRGLQRLVRRLAHTLHHYATHHRVYKSRHPRRLYRGHAYHAGRKR